MLQAHTPHGRRLPLGSGYQVAALIGSAVLIVAGVVSFALPRRSARLLDELLVEESIAEGVPLTSVD